MKGRNHYLDVLDALDVLDVLGESGRCSSLKSANNTRHLHSKWGEA